MTLQSVGTINTPLLTPKNVGASLIIPNTILGYRYTETVSPIT